jgi:hypothetical protein
MDINTSQDITLRSGRKGILISINLVEIKRLQKHLTFKGTVKQSFNT